MAARGVSVRYDENRALVDIDLEIGAGRVTQVLGELAGEHEPAARLLGVVGECECQREHITHLRFRRCRDIQRDSRNRRDGSAGGG